MIIKKDAIEKLMVRSLGFLIVLALCFVTGCFWYHGGRR